LSDTATAITGHHYGVSGPQELGLETYISVSLRTRGYGVVETVDGDPGIDRYTHSTTGDIVSDVTFVGL